MAALSSWGRLEQETEVAHEAFLVYRDQVGRRSLRRAARDLGKSRSLIEGWSRRHQWQVRVAAWDLEQEDARRDARVKAIEDAEKRHGALARTILARVAAELRPKGRKCQTCGRGSEVLTPSQIATWLRVGVDVERLQLGLGTTSGNNTQVNVQTNVVAGSVTNLVLLRDHKAQELASSLLGHMKTLNPGSSLRKLGGQSPAQVEATAEEEAPRTRAAKDGVPWTRGPKAVKEARDKVRAQRQEEARRRPGGFAAPRDLTEAELLGTEEDLF